MIVIFEGVIVERFSTMKLITHWVELFYSGISTIDSLSCIILNNVVKRLKQNDIIGIDFSGRGLQILLLPSYLFFPDTNLHYDHHKSKANSINYIVKETS